MRNNLEKILSSSEFIFYTKIIGAFVGGVFTLHFIYSNQIEFLEKRNESTIKAYELSKEIDLKKCKLEQEEMKNRIEMEVTEQYKKLDGKSKEAKLFLETYKIINSSETK